MKYALLLTGLLLDCTQPPPAGEPTKSAAPSVGETSAVSPAAVDSLANREWRLAELGEQKNPLGAGGRPITLRFEEGTRAAGFGGCNRYTGSYTARGDSVSFGPIASTKMACTDGMQLEQSYLAMLPLVVRYSLADSILTLMGAGGPVAVFQAAPGTP